MSYGNYAPFYRGGYFNPMQAPTMPNMAENQNQYAQPYQAPMQPIQNIIPSAPTQNQSNDIIWVQGEAGAKAYLVAPNTTITLWDSESPTIYVKTSDINGVPSMRVLDFTERNQNTSKNHAEHVGQCKGEFIPINKLDAINERFDGIDDKIKELEIKIKDFSVKPATKTTKTAKEDE